MSDLAAVRCFNHPEREAAARCPRCRRHFCRECVTEHDGRMLCASCIVALAGEAAKLQPRRDWREALRPVGRLLRLAAGVLAAWAFFYSLGQTFALWPEASHAARSAAEATTAPPAGAGDKPASPDGAPR